MIVAVALAACWPTLVGLHNRWTLWSETTYTHGYLIAAISLYLLWRANVRHPAPSRPARPLVAFAALILFGFLWAFAVRAGIVALELFLFPVLLLLAIWAGCGIQAARRSAFAVGFLYFALPLWDTVNGLFQGATVLAVRGMLRLVDIPAYFVGNFVQIPAGVFEIEGGCSGLHYAMVALALGALMGEMRGDGWQGRIKLLALAGGLAVLTNWIRVFTIILAGHFSDMQHPLVADSHYNYGWMLFAAAMVVFFVIERRMTLPPRKARSLLPSLHGALLDRPAVMTMAVLVAVAGLQWFSARPARAQIQPLAPGVQWSAAAGAVDAVSWSPRVLGADDQQVSTYRSSSGAIVHRHQYMFLSQRQDKELGAYGNDLHGGHALASEGVARIGGRPVTVRVLHDAGGDPWLMAASYSVAGHHSAAPLPAQVRYALHSLARWRSRPALLTLWRTPCIPDCQTAERVLGQFIETMEPEDRGP